MRAWRRVLVVGIACLGALVPGARLTARRFLFPAHELRVLSTPTDFVEHRLVAGDGATVRALELPASGGSRTIVHFHSNRETVEGLAGLARSLHAKGLGVVLAEYRGYGRSTGSPSEADLYADAEVVLDMLERRGVGAERIVLSGASLGTGVAAEMARRQRGARLVLLAPYTSVPGLVEDVVPFLPSRAFLSDRFETLDKAALIHVPTLVVHGDADEIVPFWMGERLAHDIEGAVLRRVQNGHHGDLFARDPDLIGVICAHAS